MKRLVLIMFLSVSSEMNAQNYSIDLIEPDLLVGANAVVRKDISKFTILTESQASHEVEYAVTILNEKGKGHGLFQEWYDKLSSIDAIEVNVYDATGLKIRKAKSSDILDVSSFSGNLFEDYRSKIVDLREAKYPYTVEYRFIKKYKYLYSIPDKDFYPGQHVAVENSSFTLEYPQTVGARFLEMNYDGQREESEVAGIKTITWRLGALGAYEHEAYGPSFFEVVPRIKTAPVRFSFDGYSGNLSTWDGMAKWQLKLNEGRDQLSQSTLSRMNDLTSGKSRLEKIEEVYKYVQQNTRYVSIQLGIGGFQPFPASVVDEVGYGDCKALSFYTQSLLKSVGIDSYYSWIYGGANPPVVLDSFPEDSFNHIILCVPHEKDTVWLECTSQTNPFGYLGRFTGDRKALVINDAGGFLVNTKHYPTEGNIQTNKVVVNLGDDGNGYVDANLLFSGLKSEYRNIDSYVTLGTDKQKDWIKDEIDIPTFEVKSFSLNRENGEEIRLMTNLWVNKLVSKSGNRVFLQPNILNKNQWIPLKYADRKLPIIEEYGFIEIDTVQFQLPSTYSVEAYFEPISISSVFGEYRAEIQSDENGLRYIRYFKLNNGRFDPSLYTDYIEFHKQTVNADKRKISIVTGT
jgi:transglutaminase-like putative cysteine protease